MQELRPYDIEMALKIFREARSITKPWVEAVERDLQQHGILHVSGSGHSKEGEPGVARKLGFLSLLARTATKTWRLSKKKKQRPGWQLTLMKEMHRLLSGL